ncbi:MAG: hypothetical protein ACODAJ_16665 [Planctomycetota bacterium]
MTRRPRGLGLWASGLLLAVACSSCTSPYLRDRGNDAKDMFEIGLTFSGKPGFALHQDYFNYIPHGFSYVPDGCIVGNVNRQLGVSKFEDYAWGYFVRGWDHRRLGEFDPTDLHQFPQDRLAKLKAEGEPVPQENPGWSTGVCAIEADSNAPWPTFVSCRRNVHLGFVGLYASLHPADILDFLVGWTTADLMNDDYHTQAAQAAAK